MIPEERGAPISMHSVSDLSPADTVGATQFIHPITGVVAYGADIRPGVDTASSSMPNPAYGE